MCVKSVILLSIYLIFIESTNGDKITYIVGGTAVKQISEAPYQLSLRFFGSHKCGGSVLSAYWALSAAHCFPLELDMDHLSFAAGELSITMPDPENVYELAEYHRHPNYNKSNFDFDVAVAKVTRSFFNNKSVKPIRLVTQNMPVIYGEPATATGWGKTESGIESQILLKVNVPLFERDKCQSMWPVPVTDRMLCAGGEQGFDSCSGDSGGPLVYRKLQVGISSWGGNVCGSHLPSAYSFISHPYIRQFIRNYTGV